MAEAADLKSVQRGFDPHRDYMGYANHEMMPGDTVLYKGKRKGRVTERGANKHGHYVKVEFNNIFTKTEVTFVNDDILSLTKIGRHK